MSELDAAQRSASVDNELEDSDAESQSHANSINDGDSHAPGKPGRKKNPNSQAARRDQNRIAQREFRLRKQQRIRDLEARVELLSGGQDEALNDMKTILKDLMAENQTLRNLLKSVAGFIGDGAGGFLAKLGWDASDFNNFVNKSETDTAFESFQRRKKVLSHSHSESSPSHVGGSKRPADDDANHNKRPRVSGSDADLDRQNGYSLLVPLNPAVPPVPANNLYPPSTRSSHDSAMFPDLMRSTAGSPIFVPPSASAAYAGPTSGLNAFQSTYSPPSNLGVDQTLPAIPYHSNSTGTVGGQSRLSQNHLSAEQSDDDDDDPKKNEAMKLITYHLDNYKRNSAYCLPPSLRPTLVQRTVPHESVIDRILHPELRDRIILLRGRFDLVDCLFDYRSSLTIHGDDVLAHSNWEIGERWLRKYGFLVDSATLNITNRWRSERGGREIQLSDLTVDHVPPP